MEEDELRIDIDHLEDISLEKILIHLQKYEPQNKLQQASLIMKKLVSVIQRIIQKKYKHMGWEKIIEIFFEDNDVRRKYSMLLSLQAQKGVCENNQCSLFDPLDKILSRIQNLKVFTYKDGKKKYGENSQNYKDVKKTLDKISSLEADTLKDIYRLFAVKNTQRLRKEEAYNRTKEKIRLLGKYGVGYQTQVGRDIDQEIAEDEQILMPNDPDLQEDLDIFNRDEFLKQKAKEQMSELDKRKAHNVEANGGV